MNIVWAILLLVAGLALLWKSADILVDGAVALARQLGVSNLVVALTVLAMGTSAPELAAGIAAAAKALPDVAVGDVFGSNIANLALVGGLVAIIRPISIKKQTLKYQIPAMLAVVVLLWPVLGNLYLSRLEGIGLLVVFAVLILLTVYMARKQGNNNARGRNTQSTIRNTKKNLLLVVIGLAGLALGAEITVRGAVFIGRQAGLSDAVIGLTIIAVGTSLPELATCVAAAVKGHHDISIGNLVGSNIFNALLVTGTVGVIRPFTLLPRLMGVDYWIMVIVSAAFVVAAIAGRKVIGRIAGTLLLCGYVAYMVYLLAYSA
jgi:cation:H+ antiporter